MADKNYNIDDILNEVSSRRNAVPNNIDANSSIPSKRPNVDELIKQILLEKNEVYKTSAPQPENDIEKEEFYKEIKSQTRTITKKFNKLEKKRIKNLQSISDISEKKAVLPPTPPIDPEPYKTIEEEQRIRISSYTAKIASKGYSASVLEKDEHTPPASSENSLPNGSMGNAEHPARQERPRLAMEDISQHFGKRTMQDKGVEEVYSDLYTQKNKQKQKSPENAAVSPQDDISKKAGITFESYKELKKTRKQKISEFKLEQNAQTLTGLYDFEKTENMPVEGLSLNSKIKDDVFTSTTNEKDISNFALNLQNLAEANTRDEHRDAVFSKIDNAVSSDNIIIQEVDLKKEKQTGEHRQIDIPLDDLEEAAQTVATDKIESTGEVSLAEKGFEYRSPSDAKRISSKLTRYIKGLKASAVAMVILSVLALPFCFNSIAANGELSILSFIKLSPLMYIILPLIILAFGILASAKLVSHIISSIKKKKSSVYYFTIIAVAIGIVQAIILLCNESLLQNKNIIYLVPISIFLLLFADFTLLYKAKIIQRNFEYIRENGDNLFAVSQIKSAAASAMLAADILPDDAKIAKINKTNFLTGFFACASKPDIMDKGFVKILSCGILLSLICMGITEGIVGNLSISLSVSVYTLLAFCAFTPIIVTALPMRDTEDLVSSLSGVMPLPPAIEASDKINGFLVDAYDLFPDNSVVLRGIKTFGITKIDDAIIDAASVLCSVHSTLNGIFMKIIADDKSLLKTVDSVKYEDMMGISAWINDSKILIGNRDLLVNHSVALPMRGYEDKFWAEGYEVIFLATEGTLKAAFIVEYTKNADTVDLMSMFQKYDLKAIIKTMDFCITPELISNLFDIPGDCFKVLPARTHQIFSNATSPVSTASATFASNGTLFGSVAAVAASKKLKKCFLAGRVLCYIAGIFAAVLLMLMIIFTGELSNLNLLMYAVILLFPAVIYIVGEKNMRL